MSLSRSFEDLPRRGLVSAEPAPFWCSVQGTKVSPSETASLWFVRCKAKIATGGSAEPSTGRVSSGANASWAASAPVPPVSQYKGRAPHLVMYFTVGPPLMRELAAAVKCHAHQLAGGAGTEDDRFEAGFCEGTRWESLARGGLVLLL